ECIGFPVMLPRALEVAGIPVILGRTYMRLRQVRIELERLLEGCFSLGSGLRGYLPVGALNAIHTGQSRPGTSETRIHSQRLLVIVFRSLQVTRSAAVVEKARAQEALVSFGARRVRRAYDHLALQLYLQ